MFGEAWAVEKGPLAFPELVGKHLPVPADFHTVDQRF